MNRSKKPSDKEQIFYLLIAGLLASSQYPEGPALTGHLDTGFSWFSCV
jgi:hypothetical protein